MRIGINAFPLRAEGGGARYVFAGLMNALLRLDAANRYIIFAHVGALRIVHQILASAGESADTGPDARVRVIRIADEGQIYGYRDEFDLYFGPLNNLNPRVYDRPTVALLHDIQEQYLPENFGKSELVGRYEAYPEICRSATTLIAISEFCRQSFIEKFEIDPRKIEVVYNAPQAELVSPALADGYWRHEPLPERFLFYPANCYKHKNHALLLDAVERMRAEGWAIPVIFCGFEMPGGFPLKKEISARGLEALCRFHSDLPVEEIRHLYRHALATVLPTSFEGFCMPAVEAMACGCPVVCSDLPVLHEIIGDDALYFDPTGVGKLLEQIRRISTDGALRAQLAQAGPARAARFNWEDSARRVLEIFKEARERFAWAYHAPGSVPRPRIGVSVRLIQGGANVAATIESLLVTGYPELVIRCVAGPEIQGQARQFLESAGVQIVQPTQNTPGSLEDLREFAREHECDVVLEVLEGNRLKRSVLDSIGWSYLMAPEMAVYLGECFQWRGTHFTGVSRLRLTGDGLWKMEGFVFPEILAINPRVLDQWPEGLQRVAEGGPEWRWELLREARFGGKLFLSRRTLADCDQATLGPDAGRVAAQVGMFDYYHVNSNKTVKVRLFRRVEPVIKRAARILPMKWQDAGTRLWYHLAR